MPSGPASDSLVRTNCVPPCPLMMLMLLQSESAASRAAWHYYQKGVKFMLSAVVLLASSF